MSKRLCRRNDRKNKDQKTAAPGHTPARIIKEFSLFLCVPMTNIINRGLRVGHRRKTYKRETFTPTPMQFPLESRDQLQISVI